MQVATHCKDDWVTAFDIIDTLVDYGADVNAVSSNGDTALILLARNGGHERAGERLLQHGADPSLGSPGKAEALRQWLESNRLAIRLLTPGMG
jgi:ankyrin repeat protein